MAATCPSVQDGQVSACRVTMAPMKCAALSLAASVLLLSSCSYSYGHVYPGSRPYSGQGMDSGISEGAAKRRAQDTGERSPIAYTSTMCLYLVKYFGAAAAGGFLAASKPSIDNVTLAAGLIGAMFLIPNCYTTVGYGEPAPAGRMTPLYQTPITPTIDGSEYGPARKATQ